MAHNDLPEIIKIIQAFEMEKHFKEDKKYKNISLKLGNVLLEKNFTGNTREKYQLLTLSQKPILHT